jgi:hypothetical protein
LSAATRPQHAEHLLDLARGIYATAKTSHVGPMVTVFPHDFYPGTEWKSMMLWGADEIALADEALGAPAARVRADLAVAARWARAYLAQGHCMQSEIANLAGSLTGHGNIQVGATTDGPSNLGNFVGLGTVDGMRACRAGNFKPFNTNTTGYEDNVVSWPSVEPADDYTANSTLAFALAAASGLVNAGNGRR